ncbi:Fic family protein [Streptococcus danieliae]|uniref:Fic family protein n=1 Tax=Streptococcus danieliae TaxID=747656 RepID=UPI0026EDB6E0|nr:Fic family protein [Streptococcus danieliae]
MTPTYEIDNPNLSYQAKLDLWETGFGLQKVDNLEPSAYMRELAQEQIEGKLTYEEVYSQITTYHKNVDIDTREADIVALRIVELLSSPAFKFAPTTLKGIHRELFFGLLPQGVPLGEYRPYNIRKEEPILRGDSVIYDDYRTVADSLVYDFNQEASFQYRGKSPEELVTQVKKFISGIWQIHPFGEGNTRTVTVFLIKYLRSMGFEVDNEPFKNHSKYFRDALVLDNAKLMYQRPEYLDRFFENLLLGGQHQLSSSRMYQAVLGDKEGEASFLE